LKIMFYAPVQFGFDAAAANAGGNAAPQGRNQQQENGASG
jgi:hypothetical protein